MPIQGALTNAMILVNGVDLSDHLTEITVPEGVEKLDRTAMGADTRIGGPGLKTGQITAKYQQDYSAAKVDATLSPLLGGGQTFTVEVRPTNAARAIANPAWVATCFLSSYTPIQGKVGDEAIADVVFELASSLQRLTA